ncbi:MAG: prolipoprotein diacylglyceryl transferase [Anaerolineales bacterium]|nr:prolipoprotein diacylglyceryl transferase [Anaerolineales bacterium]MBX3035281.1 prolipoprotein diacylglyceryl transferase [Anaerolineales bacterium]
MNEGNGILIAFAIACGALLSAYQAKRFNHDPEIIYYLFLPLTIWGLIGARLWHIFTPPLSSVQLGLTTQHYLSHPVDALALWLGGFGIPGAILGGTLALYLFCRKYGQPFWNLADILAPAFLLAQIIGRFTNYLNQELYGLPTNLPWAIFIDSAHRLSGYEMVEFYHPLFAYEMILNSINFILLLWLGRKFSSILNAGDLFLFYLAFYSLIRFGLEFLRLDSSLINGININQVFFILLFLLTSGFLLWRHRFAQNL